MTPTLRLSKLLIVLVLLLTSCQKDDGISNDGNQNENIPDTFSEYFGNEISRDFLGTVVDKNDNPIWGVTITIGNQTTETDVNGVFILRDANVYERFGYIKAEKAGYINGSRSVIPASGTNKVTIMLLEETVVGTVSSGSSDIVTADDGSSVSFDGNFVKEDGTAYSGSVNVIMHHLDPTNEDMEDQMPGMLYAQNEDGAERMLQTLGMLAVELRGSGGEDLNLAEGSTSEIKIPVDATLLTSAPATIPLWYFDEATGYWKEEGEATLQGNMYVGTVSHFSFWNCDIPVETVTLCITVTNANNDPINNNLVIALTSSTLGSTYGVTNENGEVCGFIPSNEILELSVFSSGNCSGEILLTQTIGSFSTDSDITITVPENPNTTVETIAGTLNTCDGDSVTDGYVQLFFDDQTFTDTVTDGTFEINLLRCNNVNEFSLEGINLENLQSSSVMDFDFSSPTIENINLSACDDFQSSFIVYQFGDYEPNYIIPSTTDFFYDESEFTCNFSSGENLFTGHSLNGTLYAIGYGVYFYNFTGPGIYTLVNENIGSDEPYVFFEIYNRFSHITEPIIPFQFRTENFNGTIEVTTFGEVGEFVEYFISGTVDIVRYQGSNVLEIMDEGIEIQGYTRLIRKN